MTFWIICISLYLLKIISWIWRYWSHNLLKCVTLFWLLNFWFLINHYLSFVICTFFKLVIHPFFILHQMVLLVYFDVLIGIFIICQNMAYIARIRLFSTLSPWTRYCLHVLKTGDILFWLWSFKVVSLDILLSYYPMN